MNSWLMWTHWNLPFKQLVSQVSAAPLIPYFCSFIFSISWLTVFVTCIFKSRKTPTEYSLFSTAGGRVRLKSTLLVINYIVFSNEIIQSGVKYFLQYFREFWWLRYYTVIGECFSPDFYYGDTIAIFIVFGETPVARDWLHI